MKTLLIVGAIMVAIVLAGVAAILAFVDTTQEVDREEG